MWVIKNRVTGEYDHKGSSGKRNTVARAAWGTLGHAKSHIVNAVCNWRYIDEWYMDADFIEMTDTGIGRVEPVVEYLKEHYSKNPYCHVSVKKKLGLITE